MVGPTTTSRDNRHASSDELTKFDFPNDLIRFLHVLFSKSRQFGL
jgi:hypothetical protein